MKDVALLAAGLIFSFVTIMHLWRVLARVEVKVKNFVVPLWFSVIGFLVSISMAIWMFKSRG